MRTTMIINDELYRQVKERARAEDRTVTSFVEAALRRHLAQAGAVSAPIDVYLAPPTRGGGASIDLSDPKAAQRLLDEEDIDHQLEIMNRISGL